MSLYIHHVPGRLRVRTESFRCRANLAEAARARLSGLDGVSDVAINPRSGSITVRYEPGRCTQAELLGVLEEAGCIGARRRAVAADGAVAGLFGKALIGALAQTVAQRSVQTLVGVLR
jgi:copper chaperone CopZ